jgi:hypothetical protein
LHRRYAPDERGYIETMAAGAFKAERLKVMDQVRAKPDSIILE